MLKSPLEPCTICSTALGIWLFHPLCIGWVIAAGANARIPGRPQSFLTMLRRAQQAPPRFRQKRHLPGSGGLRARVLERVRRRNRQGASPENFVAASRQWRGPE